MSKAKKKKDDVTVGDFKSWISSPCSKHFFTEVQLMIDEEAISIRNIEEEGMEFIKKYGKIQGRLEALQDIFVTADLLANPAAEEE